MTKPRTPSFGLTAVFLGLSACSPVPEGTEPFPQEELGRALTSAPATCGTLEVSKTAETRLQRSFDWSIRKSAALAEMTLAPGQVVPVGYEVVVATTGMAESAHVVSGLITIKNPAPEAATITSVVDELPGALSMSVDCHVSFPFLLAPGGTLLCDYVGTLPNSSACVNTVVVSTTGSVAGASATAGVDFGSAQVEELDRCVNVTDSLQGALGQVCVPAGATSASQTFSYQQNIGPYDVCGDIKVLNVATYTGCKTGSASAEVLVHVPCSGGCSLTPGYWKTHSVYGPASADPTWSKLPGGADTVFFLSGLSYHQALWTQPAGNAYYVLAHAFIAAELNRLGGADTSVVTAELQAARDLLAVYTPAAVGAMKGSAPVRKQFINVAATLDQYNNGVIGPGHCN